MFKNVSPGTEVLLCAPWYVKKTTVERVTKTIIVVEGKKYRLKNGLPLEISSVRVRPFDHDAQRLLDEQADVELRNRVWRLLSREAFNRFPLELIGKI